LNSIYFETYGCTTNRADTDVMKGIVEEAEFELACSPDEADFVVINTCTVIDKTEKRMLRRIRELSDKNLIVAGCLASAQPEVIRNIDKSIEILPPSEVGDLLSHVGGTTCFDKWSAPSNLDGVIGRVQIADGCLGNCSYCITKKARGELESSPVELVLQKIEELVFKGAKEIQLTAQDTAAYGKDIESDLPTLIDNIMGLEGDFRVRVGMMNPFSIKGMENEILNMYQHNRIYNFLHLPLQSGSNKILKKMGRPYTQDYYLDFAGKYKEKVGGVLSTDVIAGFPNETQQDFNETISTIKKLEPDIINITRYSPRPGTKASEKNEIKSSEKKERSKRLTKLRKKYGKQNKKPLIGSKRSVLVTKPGKKDTYIGRDKNYNPVVIKNNVSIGQEVEIEIDDYTFAYLEGRKTNP